MEHKNIVATIYLKNGQAVKGMDNFEPMGWDVISLARLYNDSGIDKIIIFDLSEDDEEHEKIFKRSKTSIVMLRSKSVPAGISAVLKMLRSLFMPDVCRLL